MTCPALHVCTDTPPRLRAKPPVPCGILAGCRCPWVCCHSLANIWPREGLRAGVGWCMGNRFCSGQLLSSHFPKDKILPGHGKRHLLSPPPTCPFCKGQRIRFPSFSPISFLSLFSYGKLRERCTELSPEARLDQGVAPDGGVVLLNSKSSSLS